MKIAKTDRHRKVEIKVRYYKESRMVFSSVQASYAVTLVALVT